MRQPAFMGKHLAKIADVDPDAAYRALDEMRGWGQLNPGGQPAKPALLLPALSPFNRALARQLMALRQMGRGPDQPRPSQFWRLINGRQSKDSSFGRHLRRS